MQESFAVSWRSLIHIYYKTPSFLTGRCIVSLAILGLISCSDRNGKSLSEATNDPAGIYREYLYNIRRQKDSSFQVLTKHILQWQTVKDSVFRYLRNDTLSHPHSNQREECIRLHDSIRTEFSRLALSKTRTYQELLALKGEFSPCLLYTSYTVLITSANIAFSYSIIHI